tara:strand:+ start:1129 stop:1494 length:366 start_codon:yes stop_codon:yes gene_type:complete
MPVSRLSKEALQKILRGNVVEESTCVIKFYSNSCHLCHNLKDYYQDISDDMMYSDVHFFAFNIDDYPTAERILNFNGVPTISLVKTGGKKPKIRIIPDPENPNDVTWYKTSDIRSFINKEK